MPVNMAVMQWIRASLFLQIILALYFQAILWFPLETWNQQRGERLIGLALHGHAAPALGFAFVALLPLLFFALAVSKRWMWLMWLGLVGYGTWAAMQIQSWWRPWLFGANRIDLANTRALKNTYKIFPSTQQHLAPDAMHFVLDLLLFAVVATLAIGLIQTAARSQKQATT